MNRPRYLCYEFGPFRLDALERQLLCGAQTVALTPKAFDTLLVLIENCKHVVGKDELMARVWPDSYVEETNLAQNISLLRKLLGERADGGQYIETVPKRGYRFVVEVTAKEVEPVGVIVRERMRTRVVVEEDDVIPDASATTPVKAKPPSLPSLAVPNAARVPQTSGHYLIVPHAPEVHYVTSGDANIAYQVVGDGPLDLLFVMGWVSHLEYFWAEPSFARFLTRLSSFSRLILFDKRGTGLSDRVPLNQLPTLEQRMEDVHAVLNAVGSDRAALCGVSEGGPMCSLFAATYPQRTTALAMIGTYARRIWEPEYPWAPTNEERAHFFEEIRTGWGGPVGLDERAPSVARDSAFCEWWATYLRMGASPNAALALTQMNAEIDVRPVLPSIRVPTLVIHRTGDLCLKVEEGRYVAEHIPGAKFVELPGVDHLPFVGDQDAILDEIEEFLTGVRHQPSHDTVLATVLFVAPAKVVEPHLSAERRHELLERHFSHTRRELELYKGRAIERIEDSFMAIFDGPARAIRCASAISDFARRSGVQVQVGLHTGECDLIGEKVSGLAVELGKRLAEFASAGEVLVSRTVKDLVAGSGLRFRDQGVQALGDEFGEWQLFTVERSG